MKLSNVLKSRPGLNTAIGVAFAVVAGLLLLGYVSQLFGGERGGPLLDIPVATHDIGIGNIIDGSMMTTRKIASEYLVPGTVRERDGIEGSRALRFIGKGEPFTSSSVSGGDGPGTLASRIPPSMRAYSLRLSPLAGSSGDIRPGDHVDVLATVGGDPPSTATILTNRLILSVSSMAPDGEVDASRGNASAITLLVSPDEAERLARAEFEGEISISLCPLAGVDQ
ncbi:MAG: Flp pilus assembly protein CpaB [Actinobacteria bacterium]|nr:Flp pilus assembly protein CpaB [Actinomycetota bacterium]MCG2818535.1 Flp pilus assembly protein CpaB [Actinomycetes bacterium]MBU4218276.1 Flp pilus assembly protein CpaB [Actinomycetota bacterium]MBU4358701.1 Flp pilus assembly protein CpaB [Actinomycetota bacterium]MBU4391984.1 Flp pilus assembly protein CpaB [Actinomycetota bacterium]